MAPLLDFILESPVGFALVFLLLVAIVKYMGVTNKDGG